MWVLLLAGCDWSETKENAYPDVQAAEKAGAIDRGWVPAFLPPSAKDIVELHDLDTKEVWMRFELRADTFGGLERACFRRDVRDVEFPRESEASWWPDVLRGYAGRHRERSGRYVYYRCQDGAWLAKSETGPAVYYWKR